MNGMDDPKDRNEFLVSQYLDGSISPHEENRLKRRLIEDDELAQLERDHRQVDRWVRQWGQNIPQVDWSRFEAEFRARRMKATPRVRRRTRIFKLITPLAAAAAIVLAFTVVQYAARTGMLRVTSGESLSRVTISRAATADEPRVALVRYTRPAAHDEPEAARARSESTVVIAYAAAGSRVDWRPFSGRVASH